MLLYSWQKKKKGEEEEEKTIKYGPIDAKINQLGVVVQLSVLY